MARTRLVILSRRDGIIDRLKGRLVGAHAYLTKPFNTDQLVAVIQASLEEKVPGPEGGMRQREYEMVSSENRERDHLSAGVFPLR